MTVKKETERTWLPIERLAINKALFLAVDRVDMGRIHTWSARVSDRPPDESKVKKVGHLRAVVDMNECQCITHLMFADEDPVEENWADEHGVVRTTPRVHYTAHRLFRGDRTGSPLSWYEVFRFIPAYVRKVRRRNDGTCPRPLVPLKCLLWSMGRDFSDYPLVKAEYEFQMAATAEDVPDPSGDYRGDLLTDFAEMTDTLWPFVRRNDPRTRCAYWNACMARAEVVSCLGTG